MFSLTETVCCHAVGKNADFTNEPMLLRLIDQSAEIVEPDQPTAADETPQPAAQAVWNRITTLFTVILNWLLRVLGIA